MSDNSVPVPLNLFRVASHLMDNWERWSFVNDYVVPVILTVVFMFMIWIRVDAQELVVQNSVVYFAGNDAWYHARITQIITAHFPATPVFDPWSYFPYGTGRHSGFGGLFDQLIAFGALMISGGSPSSHQIEIVTAYAPPLFGAITVIPLFYVTREIRNKWTAIIAAVLLSLLGGQFLNRTVIGAADHSSAEPFFGTLALLGYIVAIRIAYREKPLFADIRDRNWIALRHPITWSVLGGVAIAAYLMTWPPGIFVAFTFGVYFVLQAIRDHFDGRPLDYISIVTGLSMGVGGLLVLFYTKSVELSATAYSFLQPVVLFGIVIGALALFAFSEYGRQKDYRTVIFPVSIALAVVTTLIVASIIYPRSINLLKSLILRVYSFGMLTSPTALTVGEIHPASLDDAWGAFGPLFHVAIVGLVIMTVRVFRENRPIELLFVLFSLSMFSAYFTMIRFGYYVAVNVAILSAFAIWWVGDRLLSLDLVIQNPRGIKGYQIIGFLVIVMVVIPGTVVGVEGTAPVWQQSEFLGGSDTDWHHELDWMNEHTPSIPLDYTASYSRPADGDFDYPVGTYGVLSWWDYGHWITYTAHRIPAANPFQQGPRMASAFFQAQSEERAELLLEALPSQKKSGSLYSKSDHELQQIIAKQSKQEASEDIRYIIIDDQMAAGKFSPIATWTGPGYGAYISTQEFQVGQESTTIAGLNDRYRNTMLSRLYFDDAKSMDHYRLVHESDRQMTFASVARRTGGEYRATRLINRRVSPQLLQAVQRNPNLIFYDVRQSSRVKTYERVTGASLTGTVTSDNTSTVYAFVQLRTNTGRNFTYVESTQVTNRGRFNMTVPYPTTNNVNPADDGTDSGVVAIGPYQVVEGNPFNPMGMSNVSVPEKSIYEGSEINVNIQRIEDDET